MVTEETSNNRTCVKGILEAITDIHAGTLQPGFYGKVIVEWQVKDGSIQQNLVSKVEETKRLSS